LLIDLNFFTKFQVNDYFVKRRYLEEEHEKLFRKKKLFT